MTLKEFKDKFQNVPDDTELAIVLSDGSLDFCVFANYDFVDDGNGTVKVIKINGN